VLGVIDFAFFSADLLKIAEGGDVPARRPSATCVIFATGRKKIARQPKLAGILQACHAAAV
jgi:hypothetical protein